MNMENKAMLDRAEEAAEYAEAYVTAVYEAGKIAMSAYAAATPATVRIAAKAFYSAEETLEIARDAAKKAREHANSVRMEVTK